MINIKPFALLCLLLPCIVQAAKPDLLLAQEYKDKILKAGR